MGNRDRICLHGKDKAANLQQERLDQDALDVPSAGDLQRMDHGKLRGWRVRRWGQARHHTQAPHVPLYPDHSGVSTFLAVFSLPGICRVVHFQLLGTLVVFLGFSRKPYRGFPMSRLGALLLFRGDIVRIIPGIASFFLGDGYLKTACWSCRTRAAAVLYRPSPEAARSWRQPSSEACPIPCQAWSAACIQLRSSERSMRSLDSCMPCYRRRSARVDPALSRSFASYTRAN